MEGAGCFYFAWKRLLKFIFYSCHKVSAQVVEGRAGRGNDVTTIEEIIDIQEEACIIVRPVGEIEIREELGLHRCIGRRITRSVAKVADMKRRGQFTTGLVYARIESDPSIIIVPWILFRGSGSPVTIHCFFVITLFWMTVRQPQTV